MCNGGSNENVIKFNGDLPGATAVDEEDGDRRAKESAEQTDQAGRITVLAAALSFTHFDELPVVNKAR